jgi:hypothetical protein
MGDILAELAMLCVAYALYSRMAGSDSNESRTVILVLPSAAGSVLCLSSLCHLTVRVHI